MFPNCIDFDEPDAPVTLIKSCSPSSSFINSSRYNLAVPAESSVRRRVGTTDVESVKPKSMSLNVAVDAPTNFTPPLPFALTDTV